MKRLTGHILIMFEHHYIADTRRTLILISLLQKFAEKGWTRLPTNQAWPASYLEQSKDKPEYCLVSAKGAGKWNVKFNAMDDNESGHRRAWLVEGVDYYTSRWDLFSSTLSAERKNDMTWKLQEMTRQNVSKRQYAKIPWTNSTGSSNDPTTPTTEGMMKPYLERTWDLLQRDLSLDCQSTEEAVRALILVTFRRRLL